MTKRKQRYLSFLFRLWPASGKGAGVWRVSLESSHSGEHWGFATLEELFAFLRQQTAVTLDSKLDERRCDDEETVDFGMV